MSNFLKVSCCILTILASILLFTLSAVNRDIEKKLHDAQTVQYKDPWYQNPGLSKAYDINCYQNKCEVFLSSHIDEPDQYITLIKLIETAPKNSIINLHLSGYGGMTDTVFYIQNAIELSKAEVNTIIDGPVYSAHAYLAMIGTHITIASNVFFMFHGPAVTVNTQAGTVKLTLDEACALTEGLSDRGRSAYTKCLNQNKYYNELVNNYFTKYVNNHLTSEEIKGVETGDDVYISGTEMKKRIEEQSNAKIPKI